MITLSQYWAGRDLLYRLELTQEIRNNAELLLERVNTLLTELGVNDARTSSGWRPVAVNRNTPGASKKSYHMTGKAIDIVDPQHELYNKILARPELLERLGLWMEDKGSTVNWTHLDLGVRSARTPRVFKP